MFNIFLNENILEAKIRWPNDVLLTSQDNCDTIKKENLTHYLLDEHNIKMLNGSREEEALPKLIDTGTYNLHIVHEPFKFGVEKRLNGK